MNKMAYEAPQIEIAEIAVEQGIASSAVNSTTATEYYKWKDEMEW